MEQLGIPPDSLTSVFLHCRSGMWSFYILAFIPAPSSVPSSLLRMAEAEQKGTIPGSPVDRFGSELSGPVIPFLFGNS